MSSDPSAVGRAVGRYEILRQIGQGAMATVHLARQLDLERNVALKELDRFGAGESPVFAARFLREARLAGSLSHPNIVTVYEYFEHEGRPYIAMEHVERGSLREHLENLSLSHVIGVLEGLLEALQHAEARGIVHRDIKPENILVTGDGRIKIGDFGIAKAYSLMSGALLTATGSAVGTPMYMAPEQATGGPLSIATDLYAVGIVAFEMLFGYVPFGSGDSPLAIIWQHVNDPVPDPRALRPDLDPRLCNWLEQLLAKDPADRPASAGAALDTLEEIALEMLGSRWRREAPLQARAAAIPDAPQPASPLSGAEVPIDANDSTSPAGGPAGPDATRDAGDQTIAPRALRDQTEHYGRAHRDRPVGDAPQPAPTARWSVTAVALVVAATLVAAAGGYFLFDRDVPASRSVRGQPVSADSAASKRFAEGLARAFERLNKTRLSAREQMAKATTARAQAVQGRALESAYRKAALAVDKLAPGADQKAAADLLSEKLVLAGRAYGELADAARDHRTDRYAAERYAVGVREDRVRAAAAPFGGAAEAVP